MVLLILLFAGCADQHAPAIEPAAPSPTSMPSPTPTASPEASHTPSPTPAKTVTPTPSPTPLPGANLLAFETDRDGNAEIYLLDAASGAFTNLTRDPAEDGAPAWRPDGGAIAFESHRDGNWELYLLDLTPGTVTRLTDNLAYDGAPAWSPDGSRIAFESYRDGNLEIYTAAADGTDLRRLTSDPAGDYGPAWSPDGAWIAFTSWRDGNKEIYLVPAAGGPARNLTNTPADDEGPAWSPDGTWLAFTSWRDVTEAGNRNAEIYRLTLADGTLERLTHNPWPDLDPATDAQGRLVWAAYDPGPPFETHDPYRPGDYHLYRATANGSERLTATNWDDRRPAPAPAQVPDTARLTGLLLPLPATATPQPAQEAGSLAKVVEVPSVLAGDGGPPVLVNELVGPSLAGWQQEIESASGWDFLHLTHGSWRNVDQVGKRIYGYLSWHKTGRALDGPFEYLVDGVDQLLIAREDLGASVFWRIYLRTAKQDGSQGEPLKDNPWLRWWWIVPEEDPSAYEAGGKRLPIPGGYYVDVTALAKRHGWERIASYAADDYDWRSNSDGTEYWHYERTDGLSWWEAMRQIYPLDTLQTTVGWEAGLLHGQTEEMMRSKGVPTPVP